MHVLGGCLVCGSTERTIVAEYNRLLAIDWMWQNDLARYDYALCHRCGIVYATRRPDHEEYEFLYANFNEFLKRTDDVNIFTYPGALTPELIDELQTAFVPWWDLRNAPIPEGDRVIGPLRWEFEDTLGELPVLLRHSDLAGKKVLQIRAKSGNFADFLKRVFGAAEVDLITLFPVCEYVSEKAYGLKAESCLNYETFSVPFDDVYDVILANHMLVHCLNYASMFSTLDRHLAPNGRLFLRKELGDSYLFEKGKNLFSELRPFHFQQFDIAVLDRILRRFGYTPLELCRKSPKKPDIIGIASRDASNSFEPMSPEERGARLTMYRDWRDESIISLAPERAEALFGDEVKAAMSRVEERGALKRGKDGSPKLPRPLPCDEDATENLAPVKQGTLVAAQ